MSKSEEKNDQAKTKRFTKQRQAILEILRNTCIHPDANYIYKKVIKKIPNISLGTVYRNLNILVEEKVIRELTIQPNITRYDGNLDPHHHVNCSCCNRIEDIHQIPEPEIANKLEKTLTSHLQYKDLEYEIIFTGTCPDCQNKKL